MPRRPCLDAIPEGILVASMKLGTRVRIGGFLLALLATDAVGRLPTQDLGDGRPSSRPASARAAADPAQKRPLTGSYASRPDGSKKLATTPGLEASAPAIEAALTWLARHQDGDGRFDAAGFKKHDPEASVSTGPGFAKYDVGVTGLALLAFLGDGNTTDAGPHRERVTASAKWLIGQQQKDGLIGTRETREHLYGHAIATLALCEAYATGRSEVHRAAAQKALDLLEAHRTPNAAWGYESKRGPDTAPLTNWCTLAILVGRDAGLRVKPQTIADATRWQDSRTDPKTGHCGYAERGDPASRHVGGAHEKAFPTTISEGNSAGAMLCRVLAGQKLAKQPVLAATATLLASTAPKWSDEYGKVDLHDWFWCSQALFQAGGSAAARWQVDLSRELTAHQRKDASHAGSWDPEHDCWGEDYGRVGATALATLTLQANYRWVRVP